MHIIERNILDIKDGIICHQVNCMGVAKSGLALQVRNMYPLWGDAYEKYINQTLYHLSLPLLGTNFYYWPFDSMRLCIVSMFAQMFYGKDRCYTEYGAFDSCCHRLSLSAPLSNIYFPYKIGCGLGGGNWDIVSRILTKYFPDKTICVCGSNYVGITNNSN